MILLSVPRRSWQHDGCLGCAQQESLSCPTCTQPDGGGLLVGMPAIFMLVSVLHVC